MSKEQKALSPSIVCIHMNVDNKRQPGGVEMSCKCRDLCNKCPYSTSDLSKRRRNRRRQRKHSNRPSSGSPRYASGSSNSSSTTDSAGVVWQRDLENSQSKESSSNSTSATGSEDKKKASPGQSIMYKDSSPGHSSRRSTSRARSRHTKARSKSRSRSRSSSSRNSQEEYKQVTGTNKKPLACSRKGNRACHRKHRTREKYSIRTGKHKRSGRSKSPRTLSRTSSSSYSNAEVEPANSRSHFVSELCSVMKPIGIVNTACTSCGSGNRHAICVCDECLKTQPSCRTCLLCSPCYVIPSAHAEHAQRHLASNCSEFSCPPSTKKSHTRDKHAHKKSHRHESRRDKASEKRTRQGHSRSSRERKGPTDRRCVHGCHCAECCVSRGCPQFYQCKLLLGQCCAPVTPAQCILVHRDKLHSRSHTKRETD